MSINDTFSVSFTSGFSSDDFKLDLGVLIPNSPGETGGKQGKPEDWGTWILSCEPKTTNFLFCCFVDAEMLISELSSMSTKAMPMPFELFGWSQKCLFSEKFFGVGIFLSAQKVFASAEKGFVSRIEVGLMMDSVSEENVKKLFKNLGELKKNELGFGLFSGGSHRLLLCSPTIDCLLVTGLDLFLSITPCSKSQSLENCKNSRPPKLTLF